MTQELPQASGIEDLQISVDVQRPPLSSLAIRLRGLWTYLSIAQDNIKRDLGQPSPQIVDVMNELSAMIREAEADALADDGIKWIAGDGPGSPSAVDCGQSACSSGACRDAVVLPTPSWLDGHENGVCIDGCIASTVAHIWSRGVQTLGSCAGHGTAPPSLVLAQGVTREAAVAAIAEVDEREFVLYQWHLVELTDPTASGALPPGVDVDEPSDEGSYVLSPGYETPAGWRVVAPMSNGYQLVIPPAVTHKAGRGPR